MSDGYVGLIRSPRMKSLAPIITRCNVELEESSDVDGKYRQLTNAKFSITNLDIDPLSKTGVTKIKIEMADYKTSEEDYLTVSNNMPSSWSVIGTYIINKDQEVTGNNNTAIVMANNIPTNPKGYYHKFRLTFLNKDDIPARLIPFYDGAAYEPYVGEDAVDVTIGGSLALNSDNNYEFTVDESQEWQTDEYAGFSLQLYNDNGSPLFITPSPILMNSTDLITISGGVSEYPSFDISTISKMRFEESQYIYVLGDSGIGKSFNGINDLNELVSVLDLTAEISSGSWTAPNTSSPVSLSSDKLKIRWKNMYKHSSVEVTNASGANVTISKQWTSIDGYAIYMYVADIDQLPSAGSYPGSSGESNGEWYKVAEINDKHFSYSDQNYYEYIIYDLPYSKNIGIWVGAFTPFTVSVVRNLKLRKAE